MFSFFFINFVEFKGKDVLIILLKLLVNFGFESKCFNIDNNLYFFFIELFFFISFNR